MNYKGNNWAEVGMDIALEKFAEGYDILCEIEKENENNLYYTFTMQRKIPTVILNQRMIKSGKWYLAVA